MYLRRPTLSVAFVCLLVAVPSGAVSEETIYDAENPSMDAEDEREASDDGDESDGGDEVIVDPENPDQPESSDDNESEEEEGESDESVGPGTFRAGYGTGLAVDTGWEGDGEDIVEWSSRAELSLEKPLSQNWRAVVEGQFYHWIGAEQREGERNYLLNAANPRGVVDVQLGESYALYRADRWTFRLGHLVSSWGSTDLVRPGDVVNPVDATGSLGLTGGSDQALPQPAVELSHVQPNWSVTGVVVPFFRANRVGLLGRDAGVAAERLPALGSQFPVIDLVERTFDSSLYEDVEPLLQATSRPDEFPKNVSAGLRATGTRWNTDFGIGYFFGWDRTPYLEVDEDVRELGRLVVEDGHVLEDFDLQGFLSRNPEALELTNNLSEKQSRGEELLSSTYRRMHTLMVDAARYVGPVGLRADVAFQPERTFVTEGLASVRRPSLFAAAGASYEKLIEGRPLSVTVEGFWLHPFAADSNLAEWFVSDGERGDEAEPILLFDGGYPGVVGAIDWATPLWNLDVRVGSLVELETGGVVLTGRVGRRWTNWLRTSIGTTIYTGPEPASKLSLGGLYDPNDRISVTVEGKF
jgi:hypothetical protein